MAEIKYTTITWDEYRRLQRRSQILEWIDADFARRTGMKLSEQVDQILDSRMSMQQMLDRFAQQVRPRRSRRPSEGETSPQSGAAPHRL